VIGQAADVVAGIFDQRVRRRRLADGVELPAEDSTVELAQRGRVVRDQIEPDELAGIIASALVRAGKRAYPQERNQERKQQRLGGDDANPSNEHSAAARQRPHQNFSGMNLNG
jgi:hypothetical protein